MQLTAPAILLAARAHGETAVIARMLTEQHGMVPLIDLFRFAHLAGEQARVLVALLVSIASVALHLSIKPYKQ